MWIRRSEFIQKYYLKLLLKSVHQFSFCFRLTFMSEQKHHWFTIFHMFDKPEK